MTTSLYNDLDFLNKYFTTKEFDFISNTNNRGQNFDNLIQKEVKTRDTIVELINQLRNNQSELEVSDDTINLLKELPDIFKMTNENLQLLNSLKSDFAKISEQTVNLLINIESSENAPDSYEEKIQDIKNLINEFSVKNDPIQSTIDSNHETINQFFNKEIVHKYISLYGIESNSMTSETQSALENESNHVENSSEFPNNNPVLRVSEKENKVYLPYSQKEIALYMEQYPDSYSSFEDVINKEFILPLDYYMKHPVVARFRETYSLIKDREAKSVMDGLKYAFSLMFRYELNPVIIAACKRQEQLEHYLELLEKNKLNEFKDFEIKFEVSLKK